jgi:hypothetical protein
MLHLFCSLRSKYEWKSINETLTQDGNGAQVGALAQRSFNTRITITQCCSPVALACKTPNNLEHCPKQFDRLQNMSFC